MYVTVFLDATHLLLGAMSLLRLSGGGVRLSSTLLSPIVNAVSVDGRPCSVCTLSQYSMREREQDFISFVRRAGADQATQGFTAPYLCNLSGYVDLGCEPVARSRLLGGTAPVGGPPVRSCRARAFPSRWTASSCTDGSGELM